MEALAVALCLHSISDFEVEERWFVSVAVLHRDLAGSFWYLFACLAKVGFDAESAAAVAVAAASAVLEFAVVAVVADLPGLIVRGIAEPIQECERGDYHHPYQQRLAAPLVEEFLPAKIL